MALRDALAAVAGAEPPKKHSVVVAGHRTSVTLEGVFWQALSRIAAAEGRSVNVLVTDIDRRRRGPLSSAIRVHVLDRLQA